MNALRTRDLVQAINKREASIAACEKLTLSTMSDCLNEMALQGKDLLAIRDTVSHGEWKLLFGKQIKISYDKAVRYMRLAANLKDLPELKTAGSLRQALALIAERTQSEEAETVQRWPGHIEGITRASKFIGFIERHPLDKWPPESVDRLREQMLPTARQLWPENFQPKGSIGFD